MKDPQSNAITSNCQQLPLQWVSRKVWKCETRIVNVVLVWVERQTKSPRISQYSSIHWSAATQQYARRVAEGTQIIGHILPLLEPFPLLWQRTRELFSLSLQGTWPSLLLDNAPLRGTEFSATPSRKIWRQWHSFLKCRPVSNTIVQAGNITFPSFLPVHSFPCLENC